MTVLVSMPHKLGGAGPSRPITHMVEAIGKAFGDEAQVLSADSFPELAKLDGMGHGIGPAYDDLASAKLRSWVDPLKSPIVFIGGGACLNQAEYLKGECSWRGGLKIPVVSTWFSSYADWANSRIAAEYAKFGITQEPIHPYLRWRAKKEQELSDVVIMPSEFCKSTYPEPTQAKAHVVGFGVDTGWFRPDPKKQQSDKLRILFPATNPYRKGLAYALEAVQRLPKGKWEMTITGNMSGNVEGLPVTMTGWVDEDKMRRLYQTHDVLLSPSVEEGQALAGLEAASTGLPLIVTPETGHPITDGKEGFLVESRSHPAITTALQYYVDNPQEVTVMGRAARAYAEARPWSKYEDGMVDVVRQAMER